MIDSKALFNIGYGLYVVTSNDGNKDNGLIVNTVVQLTSTPCRVSVTINKDNYSHDVIKKSGKMNVNCLTVDAPFELFKNFGFQSGKDADKFKNYSCQRSDNGLFFLPQYINAFMSLEVKDYLDLGSHGMFICEVTEAQVIEKTETMTYSYYHKNVKQKPEMKTKKGFVCKICGYVYEGDELPADFVCPVCKHGAEDFEPITQNQDNKKENGNMKKYVCSICGWTYDEEKGAPEHGIAPGTKFEELPDDFACPICGVPKEMIKGE